MPKYYDDWKSQSFTCKACQWSGRGADLEQGEMFDVLVELDCPLCRERVTILEFPTFEESRSNWENVSPADRLIVELAEAETTRQQIALEERAHLPVTPTGTGVPQERPKADAEQLKFGPVPAARQGVAGLGPIFTSGLVEELRQQGIDKPVVTRLANHTHRAAGKAWPRKRPSRAKAWIGGAAILLVIYMMLEVPRRLHGREWVVLLAGLCVYAVGVALILVIGRWVDQALQVAREQERLAAQTGEADA